MSRQSASQLLASRGLQVIQHPDGALETKLTGSGLQTPITVLLQFHAQQDALSGVTFSATGPASSEVFLGWLTRETRRWGNGKARIAEVSRLREDFCAGRNVNVVVTLFQASALLSFFHSPAGFSICSAESSLDPPASPVGYELPAARPPLRAAAHPEAPAPTQSSPTAQQRYESLQRCMLVSAILMQSPSWPEDGKAELKRNQKRLMDQTWDAGKALGLPPDRVMNEAKSRYGGFDQGNKQAFLNEVKFCYSQGILP